MAWDGKRPDSKPFALMHLVNRRTFWTLVIALFIFIPTLRDAWIDDHEVERESQSVGCRPPKDNERDEKLNAAQIKMR